jgi:hypothetical protein
MHYAQDSPEASAHLATIDSKLADLHDLFLQFCSRESYSFSRSVNIWPKLRVWRRQEIDRCIDLEFSVGFQDVLDRGFYPELPWSLYARGSLWPGADPDIHILSRPVFQNVPYHQLASILEHALASGLQMVNAMTEREILAHGLTAREAQVEGQADYEAYVRAQESARRAEPGAPPNAAPPHW